MKRQELEELAFTRKYVAFLGDDIGRLSISIDELKEHIRTLEEKADMQSPCTEDRPRFASPTNKLDVLVPAIADEKALLEERLLLLETRKMIFEGTKNAYEQQLNEIESFIAHVDDPLIKLIIKYHCIEQLSWSETADKIGGNSTEDSLKKAYYRHFVKAGG